MDCFHRFVNECLDYLEADDPEGIPVPSLEGMTEAEVRRARSWLENLAECRRIFADGYGADGVPMPSG